MSKLTDNYFNVLIVDDIKDIHIITINAFADEKILDKEINFISAYTLSEAKSILKEEHNKISVILLDIVLTNDDIGIDVIDYLRNELNNDTIQIIIRSGFPKDFPRERIINKNNIHDYLDKGETTQEKLYFSLKSAIFTFNAIANLEKQVKQRTKELEQIFNVSTPLIQIDNNYKIIKTNQSFRDYFKIEGQLIGRKCYDENVLNCNKHSTDKCSLRKLQSGKKKGTYSDNKILEDNKKIKYEVNAVPIRDDEGNLLSVVENIIDITDIQTKKEQAVEQNKLKDDFIGHISHDVRTPINSILLNTKFIKKENTNNESFKYIKSIETSSNILLDFIDDILTYSLLLNRDVEIVTQATNVKALFEELELFARTPIEDKGLKFNTKIKDDFPLSLMLSYKRIRQVLINLLNNARKYTETGEIILSVSTKKIKNKKTDIIFKVTDTGNGIPNNKLDRIFEAFTMIDKKNKGVGLGLSIVKQLTEAMSGKVSVESEVGKGTTFTIHLKDVEITDKPAKINTNFKMMDIVFEKGKILIADDTKNVREDIKRLFKFTNIEVVEAVNGYDAIKQVKKHKPNIVLMDISMPEMGGVEANKKIKEDTDTKHIPIFAYTASRTKNQLIRDGVFDEFDGYISKTDRSIANTIFKTVKDIVGGKQTNILIDFDVEKKFSDIPYELLRNSEFKGDIEKLKSKWEEKRFNTVFSLNNAIEFNNSILLTASKYNFKKLEGYGILVKKNIENQSITNCKRLLKKFPEIYDLITSKFI